MFYRLIFAHLLGDFVLQSRWIVIRKSHWDGLAIHVGIIAVAMVAVLWDRLALVWPWILVITLVHALADWTKVKLTPYLKVPPILPFLADQLVHVSTILAVALAAEPAGVTWFAAPMDSVWWVGSVYIIATYALSIALPLWLDPPSLMHRPLASRLALIGGSAIVLTLAWRGLPVLIPVVGLALYQWVAQRFGRNELTPTYPIEFLSAMVVAASLGSGLA